MKLIEKLKGAHERPYVAYKVVGYYSSYQEAKEALNNVHTLDDVYQSWLELHSLNVSSHTMKGYECAYHHASSNVTDGVYTHKSLRQLRKAIEMLK